MTAPISPHPEERRLATVLFADIEGFTALAAHLDFEEAGDLMNEVWLRMDAIIETEGGYIDKHLGDAVMAVWGAPRSHPDDAERAVRAALNMQKALAEVATRSPRAGASELHMRIALNTGLVLAGYVGGRGEYTMMGDTVNVASRLEHLAQPGSIIISESTFGLVRGAFRLTRLSPVLVKGKAGPLTIYEVNGLSNSAGQLRPPGAGGLETNMVAREPEMARLNEAYRKSLSARVPTLALVIGEPGLGKSRLLLEFTRQLVAEQPGLTLFSARCLAQTSRVPFFAWKSLFYKRFNLSDTASAVTARAEFQRGIGALWGRPDDPSQPIEAAHLIGSLAGLDWPDSPYLPAAADLPAARVQRGFERIRQLLSRVCAAGPGVLALDDLHWADSGSLDLLNHLLEPRDEALPLLILAGARPEFMSASQRLRGSTEPILLNPLPVSAEVVAAAYPRLRGQPRATLELLAHRAEGNPYFLEELVKGLLPSGDSVQASASQTAAAARRGEDILFGRPDSLPSTLRATLQARLDALSAEARGLALMASVVGRVFWIGAVQASAHQSPDTGLLNLPLAEIEAGWRNALVELVRAELVLPHTSGVFAGEPEYIFKHTLLREVAYGMLPYKRRRLYHAAVAGWLLARAGPDFMAMVAEHLELAGNFPAAEQHYEQAARFAQQRGAVQEADWLEARARELHDRPPGTGSLPGSLSNTV